MTTDELIGYYKALLILQYASLSNALGTVETFVGELIQDQIISQFRDAWNLDTAVGAQLDILATYRGLSRVVFGIVPADFWSLIPYNDALPNSYFGWALYNDPDPTWRFLEYNDVESVAYKLTDSQLRRLIALKAQFDSSLIAIGTMDDILYKFFTVYVNLVDNEDMTMTYQHVINDPDTDKLFAVAVLANVLPHPAGVAFNVMEI